MANGAPKQQINLLLRKARVRAGISLEGAANHLGITTASMSRAETGVSGITADRIQGLAQFYGISIADLFDGVLITMPSAIDLERLHCVVMLIQQIITDMNAKPSAQKVAEVTTQVYQREIERLLGNPTAKTAFTPNTHRAFIETMFRQ